MFLGSSDLGSSDLGFSDQGSGCKDHAGCITGVCDVASGTEIVTGCG